MDARIVQLELLRRYSRDHMLGFMRWCWWMPWATKPFVIGRHTRAIANRLDQAITDFMDESLPREKRSTYLIISEPFRHGKSDLVSRALPAYFLGRAAKFQPDVIMSGYGTSLVKGFSKKVQNIISSEPYKALYPGVQLDPIYRAVEDWRIEGSQGVVTAQGLGGSITGKGGNLIIVDDYCKNREEAESDTFRNKTWDSFTDDLMTRCNAPAAIVVVCATRWHEDDIIGRIYREMEKNPDFPRFESLVFPATKDGPDGYDILFPELYDKTWYTRQRATLGTYSSAALLDCNPVSDAMKEFKLDWICRYDNPPPRDKMNVYMFVDPSSGRKKDVGKELNDRTAITVVGYGADGNRYLLDFVYDRMNLAERTQCIFDLYQIHRPNNIFYEQIGLQADIEHILYVQNQVGWHFPITPIGQTVKKETRIRGLQPDMEAGRWWFPKVLKKLSYADGRVYFPLEELIEEEYSKFPACKHDDGLDALANVYHPVVLSSTSFPDLGSAADQIGDWEASNRANTKWKPF